jgi:hypothetical protein
MASTAAARVQKRRGALRLAGFRPVQIGVPDTRQPSFAKECLRQSKWVSKSDAQDRALPQFMDAVLSDIDGWTA